MQNRVWSRFGALALCACTQHTAARHLSYSETVEKKGLQLLSLLVEFRGFGIGGIWAARGSGLHSEAGRPVRGSLSPLTTPEPATHAGSWPSQPSAHQPKIRGVSCLFAF